MLHEPNLSVRHPDSATLGRILWLLERMLAQGERASIHYERIAPFSRGTYFRTRNVCIELGLISAMGSGRIAAAPWYSRPRRISRPPARP